MNLDFSSEDLAFRDEVRAFVSSALPDDVRRKVAGAQRLGRDDYLRWQQLLHLRGWGAPGWPEQHGGAGWNAVQRHLFDEACADLGAPPQISFGLKMVAPVLMRFGSAEQQQRFLPGIVAGIDWWCQGYSEPGAGSDLASLKTRAVPGNDAQGPHYLVNGQKTWTTLAQHADWIFCLVRTASGGRPQEGISFLLVDMKSPGITVRPITLIDGEHEVSEVWFDNVRVPHNNLVGEENRGWTCAKFLLGHERTGGAVIGASKAGLHQLKALARRQPGDDGRPLIQDVRFRDRIARIELELMALEITNLKVVAAEGRRQAPGPEASLLKIKGSEIRQQLCELAMRALGPYGVPLMPDWLSPGWEGEGLHALFRGRDGALSGQYFNFRKTSIFGGSNEIQRNIIAKLSLGL